MHLRAVVFALVLCFTGLSVCAEAQDQAERARQKAKARAANDARSQESLADAQRLVFKTVGDVELPLYVFAPKGHKPGAKRPAIVFFFGGGWTGGSPGQFAQQCRYLASRGMVGITAEYRVRSRHGVTVPECVADAKSAVRWVRANAKRLGIDPERLAAGGGSAGGHLGACVGVVPGLDEEGEDVSISSVPNAMVLFNPVMALAPTEGLGDEYKEKMAQRAEQFGGDPVAISPYHHIAEGQPPMIMFFGSADGLLESARLFDKATRKLGNRSELVISDGPDHGFFNYGREDNKYFVETCKNMDAFLQSLGYLEGDETVDSFMKDLIEGRK